MSKGAQYHAEYRAAHKAERAAYDAERKPEKAVYDAARHVESREIRAAYDRNRPSEKRNPNLPREIIGIDGEGLTEEGARPFPEFVGPMPGVHQYLYMAAWGVERKYCDLDLDPLYQHGTAIQRTVACLEFLLSLPQEALILGFSLSYDYTKILEGLDDSTLFRIARPELRQGKNGPRGILWGDWTDEETGASGAYKLNFVKGKFSVAKIVRGQHKTGCKFPRCPGCRPIRKVTVWDIFAFFQTSFIKACQAWKVVTDAEYEELRKMKARRSQFTRAEWPTVTTYCGQECRKMAELGQRLLSAHEEAGLKLTSYYGAGSTAARMLKVKFDAKRFLGKPLDCMNEAISCGFFGGRFEMSRIGPVRQKVWSYDIASAYPYQFTFLPCLACGTWELVKGRGLLAKIEQADAALVHYELPFCDALKINYQDRSSELAWGPFPFRAYGLNNQLIGQGDTRRAEGDLWGSLSDYPVNGSILYPASSGGGWVYRDEFLTALRLFPNVEGVEAWIYTRGCAHEPFNDSTGERSTMPEQYTLRLSWGKEGRGIVVKLGCNSCYGKAAQSVGNAPPFQCFIIAGMVTSGCRAQLLEAMARASDPRHILGTATDGILSTERLALPVPRDTGTLEAAIKAGKSPLGAWEEKGLDDGIMLIRPGIAFPLDAKIEAEVKARGIGKTVLADHRAGVLAQWEKKPGQTYHLSRTMFFGMKSATDPPSAARPYPTRRANYGTWAEQPQKVSYTPFPKRPRATTPRERARQHAGGTLRTWALGPEHVSAPYERLLNIETKARLRRERRGTVDISPEGEAEKRYEILLSEQPDRDEDDMSLREE